MSEKFEQSKASGPHYQLSRLAGNWEGVASVWFEPGKPPADESPVKGTMRLIMGGRFALHEYTGSMNGKPLEGIAIIGWQIPLGKYECAWVDSFHTGTAIMFSESARGAANINMLGSYAYVTPEMEMHWGWRTEITLATDDELIITAWNVSPEGEESKATETVYRRVPENV